MKLSSSSDLSHICSPISSKDQKLPRAWSNLAKTEAARLPHPGGHTAGIQQCKSTHGPYRTKQADSKNTLPSLPPFLSSFTPQTIAIYIIKSQQKKQKKKKDLWPLLNPSFFLTLPQHWKLQTTPHSSVLTPSPSLSWHNSLMFFLLLCLLYYTCSLPPVLSITC